MFAEAEMPARIELSVSVSAAVTANVATAGPTVARVRRKGAGGRRGTLVDGRQLSRRLVVALLRFRGPSGEGGLGSGEGRLVMCESHLVGGKLGFIRTDLGGVSRT